MGNWNISIEGQGAHHNPEGYEHDANRMAAAFVRQLREAGHYVSRATFTHGGSERLGGDETSDVRHHPEVSYVVSEPISD